MGSDDLAGDSDQGAKFVHGKLAHTMLCWYIREADITFLTALSLTPILDKVSNCSAEIWINSNIFLDDGIWQILIVLVDIFKIYL